MENHSPKANTPKWESVRISSEFTRSVHRVLANELEFTGPLTQAAATEFRHKTLDEVIAASSSHAHVREDGWDSRDLAASLLVRGLLKKYRNDNASDDEARRLAAMDTFVEAEAQCSAFNRIGAEQLEKYEGGLLSRVQSFCLMVLGETPEAISVTAACRHGPGTTVGTKYDWTEYDKYFEWPYTVTAGAAIHARSMISRDSRWYRAILTRLQMWTPEVERLLTEQRVSHGPYAQTSADGFVGPSEQSDPLTVEELLGPQGWESIFCLVNENRVTTVPKSSTTDRCIAIEPTLNVMLQLGVDGVIRKRLKRWGVDLDSQEKNCELAYLGSKDQRFVTFDLKSASDTVSLAAARLCLPTKWYSYLCDLRCPIGSVNSGLRDGTRTVKYEKISSMGDGYTFALEALLFTAILYAVHDLAGVPWVPDDIAVYGDDLIFPQELANRMFAALESFGFTVGPDKSFSEGPFRESCGTDWYKGQYVRPVHLKEAPTDVADLIVWYNSIRYWSYQVFADVRPVITTLAYIEARIPQHFKRLKGPASDSEMGGYMHTDSDFRTHHGYAEFERLVWLERSEHPPTFEWGILMWTGRNRGVSRMGHVKSTPLKAGSKLIPGFAYDHPVTCAIMAGRNALEGSGSSSFAIRTSKIGIWQIVKASMRITASSYRRIADIFAERQRLRSLSNVP